MSYHPKELLAYDHVFALVLKSLFAVNYQHARLLAVQSNPIYAEIEFLLQISLSLSISVH